MIIVYCKLMENVCVSDISLFKMTGILISNVGEITPSGYSLVSITSDTNKPAWRRKQLCCMLTIDPKVIKTQPLLTDIIICSRLKKAPLGFQYAGYILFDNLIECNDI